jgi:hypothetical protein
MLAEPESKYVTDALELCQAIHTVGLKVHLLAQCNLQMSTLVRNEDGSQGASSTMKMYVFLEHE